MYMGSRKQLDNAEPGVQVAQVWLGAKSAGSKGYQTQSYPVAAAGEELAVPAAGEDSRSSNSSRRRDFSAATTGGRGI
jgi:hypothetical protein